MSESDAAENTDRELWRGPDEGCGDYYADSLHITKEGHLGINCGGFVYVKPIREWHRLAGGSFIPKRRTGNGKESKEAGEEGEQETYPAPPAGCA